MSDFVTTFIRLLCKAGFVGVLVNEARGVVLAGPALFMMYKGGGNLMAMWLGFCSLTGLALSTVAPIFVARKLRIFARQPS